METTTTTEVTINTDNNTTNTSNDTTEVTPKAKRKILEQKMTPQLQQTAVMVDHVSVGQDFDTLLKKAVAVQLKALNSDTKMAVTAFDELFMLVSDQLNDVLNELHKLALLQRRTTLAKGDIMLMLRGFSLKPADLYEVLQESNYIRKKFDRECKSLSEEAQKWAEPYTYRYREQVIDNPFANVEQSQELSSLLARQPLVLLRNSSLARFRHRKPFHVPAWLPRLPPDHTYRFTPQYNHPTTDEVVVRKRVVEEGKNTERALLNLMEAIDRKKQGDSWESEGHNQTKDTVELELAERESTAIFSKRETRIKSVSNVSSSSSLPVATVEQDTSITSITAIPRTFNVEDYARRRIEIARRQVTEFEEKKSRQNNDPFIELTKEMLNGDSSASRVEFNEKVLSAVRRSYRYMLHNLPALKRRKIEAVKQAELDRDLKLKELKKLKEQMEKDSIKISLKRELEMEATLLEGSEKGVVKESDNQQVHAGEEMNPAVTGSTNGQTTASNKQEQSTKLEKAVTAMSNGNGQATETVAPVSDIVRTENSTDGLLQKTEMELVGTLQDEKGSMKEEEEKKVILDEDKDNTKQKVTEEKEEEAKTKENHTEGTGDTQAPESKPNFEPVQQWKQEQVEGRLVERKGASIFSDEEEEEEVEAATALFDDITDQEDADT